MALTEAQRVSIRYYLGWPARFHQTQPELEQAMNAVDNLPDTQTKVEGELTELDAIQTALTDARGRLKAMKVGSIVLPGQNEVGTLRSEGRRRAGALAGILGVEIRQDVFSGGGTRRSNVVSQG